ncbi:MAG: hypothetical protein ACR2G2_04945 [Pseudonocardia sp.]
MAVLRTLSLDLAAFLTAAVLDMVFPFGWPLLGGQPPSCVRS